MRTVQTTSTHLGTYITTPRPCRSRRDRPDPVLHILPYPALPYLYSTKLVYLYLKLFRVGPKARLRHCGSTICALLMPAGMAEKTCRERVWDAEEASGVYGVLYFVPV